MTQAVQFLVLSIMCHNQMSLFNGILITLLAQLNLVNTFLFKSKKSVFILSLKTCTGNKSMNEFRKLFINNNNNFNQNIYIYIYQPNSIELVISLVGGCVRK